MGEEDGDNWSPNKGRKLSRCCDSSYGLEELKRLMKGKNPVQSLKKNEFFRVFGIDFRKGSLLGDDILPLNLFIQKMHRLESLIQDGEKGKKLEGRFILPRNRRTDINIISSECRYYLLTLRYIGGKLIDDVDIENFVKLLHEIHVLIRSFTDTPKHLRVNAFSEESTTPIFKYFHIILNARWTILCGLTAFRSFSPLNFCSFVNLTNHEIEADELRYQILLELLILVSDRFSSKQEDDSSISPFPCPCIEGMWRILLKINKKKFWSDLSSLLSNTKEATSTFIDNCSMVQYKELPEMSERVFCRLVQCLSSFEENENEMPGQVEAHLKRMLENPDHKQIKFICKFLLEVSWSTSVGIILLIWEFFRKNLNGESDVINTSTSEWIVEYTGGAEYQNDSFRLFLAVLARHIRKISDSRKILGRIMPKMTPRKLRELDDLGWYRFFSLFICLASQSVNRQASSIAQSYRELVDTAVPSFNRQTSYLTIIRGLCTLIHCADYSAEIENSLLRRIEDLVDLLKNDPLNSLLRQTTSRSIALYCDLLNSHECKTVHQCLVKYMKICPIIDVKRILRVLTVIAPGNDMIFSYLKKELSTALTGPSEEVADFICAAMTSRSDLIENFGYFSLSPLVSPLISSWFLLKFVEKNELIKKLPEGGHNLIKGFFRVAMLLEDESILRRLLREIQNRGFLPESEVRNSALETFLVSVSEDSSMDKKKCLSYMEPFLKRIKEPAAAENSKTLKTTYRVGGLLVRHWSWGILYKFDIHVNLINAILQNLLTSNAMRAESYTLSPAQSEAIEKSLPDFIAGLASLPPNNAFVTRTLKDLISIYLPKFPGNNPVVKTILCLHNEDNLMTLLLEVIKSDFLRRPKIPRSLLLKICDYCSSIWSTSNSKMATIFSRILFLPLVERRLSDSIPSGLIRSIVGKAVMEEGEGIIGQTIYKDLKILISKDIGSKGKELFDLLLGIIADLYPSIVKKLLPDLEHNVIVTEANRGISSGPLNKALLDLKKAIT